MYIYWLAGEKLEVKGRKKNFWVLQLQHKEHYIPRLLLDKLFKKFRFIIYNDLLLRNWVVTIEIYVGFWENEGKKKEEEIF